jgi:rSAM/selenodomain-associated transferase 2
MQPLLSIIIPVLNEAEQLPAKLLALQSLREQCELVLVDGGSADGSENIALAYVDKVLTSPPGRAKQMNTGAAQANADIFLFLHADTQLPAGAAGLILQAVQRGYHWGRFDVQFDSRQTLFRIIAFMMNLRSRLTGIATGDQALFMTRQAFQTVNGFADIALMEDIAISTALKKLGRPYCFTEQVVTSARRWRQYGVLNTIFLMWYLRLAYFFGADPSVLASRYRRRS